MRHGTFAALAVLTMVAASPVPVLGGQPEAAGTQQPPIASLGERLPDNALASKRGGYAVQVNNQNQLDAKLYDNQAIGNVTGTNSVSDSAFSGMSGFATVVQNSGNNVIVQNATILNVQLK